MKRVNECRGEKKESARFTQLTYHHQPARATKAEAAFKKRKETAYKIVRILAEDDK
jgi:hypothetical protein